MTVSPFLFVRRWRLMPICPVEQNALAASEGAFSNQLSATAVRSRIGVRLQVLLLVSDAYLAHVYGQDAQLKSR